MSEMSYFNRTKPRKLKKGWKEVERDDLNCIGFCLQILWASRKFNSDLKRVSMLILLLFTAIEVTNVKLINIIQSETIYLFAFESWTDWCSYLVCCHFVNIRVFWRIDRPSTLDECFNLLVTLDFLLIMWQNRTQHKPLKSQNTNTQHSISPEPPQGTGFDVTNLSFMEQWHQSSLWQSRWIKIRIKPVD